MPGKPVLTLTARQADALRIFAEFVVCHRYPPSIQDTAASAGGRHESS